MCLKQTRKRYAPPFKEKNRSATCRRFVSPALLITSVTKAIRTFHLSFRTLNHIQQNHISSRQSNKVNNPQPFFKGIIVFNNLFLVYFLTSFSFEIICCAVLKSPVLVFFMNIVVINKRYRIMSCETSITVRCAFVVVLTAISNGVF